MAITIEKIQSRQPTFYRRNPIFTFGGSNAKNKISQDIFLSELDPNGHKINDPNYYEDIEKEIDVPYIGDNGEERTRKGIVTEAIERVSIPLQKVILEKHLTHLCGEKIKFTNHNLNPSQHEHNLFVQFKQGWEKRNMEDAKYFFCQSVKATGDGAFCAALDEGKFSYRVFSVLNGDKMYPVYDDKGKVRIFGRQYSAYDYKLDQEVSRMEVWDDVNVTVLVQNDEYKSKGSISWDDSTFKQASNYQDDNEWFIYQEPIPHGFTFNPVVYLKDVDGACWSPVQHLIDKLEMGLSQLFQNNKHYAFRIMVVKGGLEVKADRKGQARTIMFEDKDGDAKWMDKADASSSFQLELEETFKYIQRGSFTVFETDKVSGDLSGVALKIRYSPAIEQALNDKHFFNASIDNIVSLFKVGYGTEVGKITDYNNLDVRGDIQVYVHQSDSELYNNLVLGRNSGFISAETAAETAPHAAADELNRLERQKKREMQDEIDHERNKLLGNQDGFTPITPKVDNGENDTNTTRKILAKKNR